MDVKKILMEKFGYTFDSAEGRLATDFRQEGNSVFYDINPDSETGYTVEVSLIDGAHRHCGFSEGCFWTEWEGGQS